MTGFNLEKFRFSPEEVREWGASDPRHRNWPVVYIMNNDSEIYVGESINVEGRMRQHLESDEKRNLQSVRVMLHETFNKSACLDLESFLIRFLAGDGSWQVLNHNAGITDADYYDRHRYQKTFEEIFETLRAEEGIFQRTLPEIINSDLFKLSPFKALNHDQAGAVEEVLEGLFEDLERGESSVSVVHGNPGTGKTVVGIYLLKLLEDIRRHDSGEPLDGDSMFSDFFTPGHPEMLAGLRVGLVVPQQSLRESISRVFALTPGLSRRSVLTPYEVGASDEPFDLLVVDEAHRLNQRANQPSGPLNKKFAEINERLFGADDPEITQLDWIIKQSTHAIFMLDTGQSVRPADLPSGVTRGLLEKAESERRVYPLLSQMRVSAGQNYVEYVRSVLSDSPPNKREEFKGYDLQFFSDLREMRDAIIKRNSEHGLSRLVAGYAWKWRSKSDKSAYDIELDGIQLRWNSTPRDWINSPDAVNEVGSIHTVQGYDLNYAGVIIGRDLRYEIDSGRIVFDRSEYFDVKGRENNSKLNIKYSDEDVLVFIRNIYTVLLTRGMLGTYVYVADLPLRSRLKKYFA
ncbi:hypothetical protein GCM10022377_27250 [Zhihengliuella alba]|uniref:GIY-YIG domain-containing protein n=1 Tax=Zhihengliuella alba TaxID=547018 RepID=A0ABP7E1V9_9MICC